MILSMCAVISSSCLVYMFFALRTERRIIDDEHKYMLDSIISMHAKIDFIQTQSIDLHRMVAEMKHKPKKQPSVRIIKNEKKDH